LLEPHAHRCRRHAELCGQAFHPVLRAQFASDWMLLGDCEPVPPDFEERHQKFCRKGPGLAFVEDSPFLKNSHRRLAGCRTLHELMTEQDMPEFLGQDPPSFLFRGESVAAIEDDRALAGNVADSSSDPIEENTLNNGHTREVDDGCNIDGGTLMGKRKEPPRSSTSELVPNFSAFW
jgi:hypothetical protein